MMMASVLQTKTQRTPFPVSPARASVPDSINRPLLIVGISIVSRSPITSSSTPVSATAKQQHNNKHNQKQFHGTPHQRSEIVLE
jgi:hypothetical protein